ncbi:MAG: hypothetical protein ACNA8W_26775, partial [Bradymonadaceae bacterium]
MSEGALDALYSDRAPEYCVVGYGSTRRVESADTFDPATLFKRRRARYQRVASLFEDYVALIPLSSWLPESERAFEILELLGRLLPPSLRVSLDANHRVRIEQADVEAGAQKTTAFEPPRSPRSP